MDRRAVAVNYLQHWFALDLVASFPLDLLFAGRRLDIWRLPRLLKILRVLQYKTLTQAGSLHSLKPIPNPSLLTVHSSTFSAYQCLIGNLHQDGSA